MNIRRPGRRRLLNAAAIALIGALALSACSVRKQYGVSTTVFTPKGNCDTSRIVEVGAAFDLSGPQAALGKEYLQGLKLAINQVNHNHGVLKNHRCIELLYKDTQGNPKVADKAVLDLVNNEVVVFMVAPFTAPEIVTSGADLGLAGVPTVSMSSLDSTTKPKPYPQLFPVTPPQSSLAQAAVKYARSQHWASVAAIGENNEAGAEGVADFTADARKAGLTVTGSAHGADVSGEIQTLQSGNPQGLYVAGDDLGVGKIFQARQSASWTVPVVAGPDGADANVSSAGDSSGISVIVPTALVVNGAGQPSDPSMVTFLSALQKAEGSAAFAGSVEPYAEAYDGLQLFAYVGTSINSVQAGDVRTFIENANYQGLLASYGYTSSAHTGVASAQLTVVALSSLSNGIFHAAASASSTTSSTSTTVAGSATTSTTVPGGSTTTTTASSTSTTG